MSAHHGINISVLSQQQASVSGCRNIIAADAITHNVDYTLWLDSDMGFDPNVALRLLSHGKDIVGCTYPRRVPPYNINGRPVTDDTEGELQDFDFLPFGAMLVKTDVFRSLPEPWFFESYEFAGTKAQQLRRALTCAVNADLPLGFLNCFEDLVNDHPEIEPGSGLTQLTSLRGEDANFCREARRHGYKVWCDIILSGYMVHIGKQCISIGAKVPGMPSHTVGYPTR
jgi:hypothetical protein